MQTKKVQMEDGSSITVPINTSEEEVRRLYTQILQQRDNKAENIFNRISFSTSRFSATENYVEYMHQTSSGVYHLLYDRVSGVLQMTRNLAPTEQDLNELERKIAEHNVEHLRLTIMPHGKIISLDRVTEIKYIES